jgi:Protein of unknown function (DUF1153)
MMPLLRSSAPEALHAVRPLAPCRRKPSSPPRTVRRSKTMRLNAKGCMNGEWLPGGDLFGFIGFWRRHADKNRAPAIVRRTLLGGAPAAGTKRWVARPEAAVAAAVQRGLITQEEACRRYELSEEEFSSGSGLRIMASTAYASAVFSDTAAPVLLDGAKAASTAAIATQRGSSAPVEERLLRAPVPALSVSGRV